ncbi:MAG: 7-carboxy-7-deazaguanine synthase QueE [Nitrospinae bacterium]|nr:7-carboxy-7-deazaguanine synthase QueE [Nitrospinota bacterium]
MMTKIKEKADFKVSLADPLFFSLQGEGATIGRPSVFIRLMGCSVGCVWCDTKYSWSGPPVEEKTIAEILDFCEDHKGAQVVVTGGEPLESSQFPTLIEELHGAGLRVEVETAGHIPPSEDALQRVDQWNVSPKLQSAQISEDKLPKTLDWLRRAKEPYLKFVVHRAEELDEVENVLDKYSLGGFPRNRIIISPGGKTREQMEHRLFALAEASMNRSFRFTPRLHVMLWGDKRGV